MIRPIHKQNAFGHKLKSTQENKSNIYQLITQSAYDLESNGPKANWTWEKAAPSMSTGNNGTHAQVLSPAIAQVNTKN